MARAGLLVALGLVCILPSLSSPAGACSWALPPPLATLEPVGDALAANGRWQTAGILHANGTYEPVVHVGLQTMGWAASPDGRWFAYASGAPVDEPQGGIHGHSTCWMPLGATEVVDRATGARVRLVDGAAYALAFSDDSLAVATATGLLVYETGAWTRPDRVELPFPPDVVRRMVWHGDVLAVVGWDARVAVGGALLTDAPWAETALLHDVAFGANGTRLAVLVDDRLHVADVAAKRWIRDVELGARGSGLAWGEGWIAVTTHGEDATHLLVAPPGWADAAAPPERLADSAWIEKRATFAGAAGDVAWLADGTLAVAAGEELLLVDPRLDDEADPVVVARAALTNAGDAPAFPPPDLHAERGPPKEAPAWRTFGAAAALALVAARMARKKKRED